MNQVLAQSETDNIMEQIERSEMNEIRYKSEQALIEEELRKLEDREMRLAQEMSRKDKKETGAGRPGWFGDLLCQGFS